MAQHHPISTVLLSDVGRVRGNNEDAVAEDKDLGLLVLADGMGGYNAGEVASQLATRTVLDVVRQGWKSLPKSGVDSASGLHAESLLLKRGIEQAHRAISTAARIKSEHAGMGTTIVAALLFDDRVSVAHVGDSRLYRYRLGGLRQLTRDHSLLEELVARGELSRADAKLTVKRNIVTRALGAEGEVQVELSEHDLEVGDVLLMCSDGLTDMVPEERISLSLRQHSDTLTAAARDLVQQALDGGGRDNVSVALAKVEASFARGAPWYQRLARWI